MCFFEPFIKPTLFSKTFEKILSMFLLSVLNQPISSNIIVLLFFLPTKVLRYRHIMVQVYDRCDGHVFGSSHCRSKRGFLHGSGATLLT